MTSTIPEDLKALHAQIMDCELKGLTSLGPALRTMLHTQIRERGLSADSLAFPEQPGTLYPSGVKSPKTESETPASGHSRP